MRNYTLLIILLVTLCLSLFNDVYAQTSEEITITTYYPSPYGVYDDLEARDGFAVGNIATNGPFGVNSVDALDTGELWVEDSVIFRPLPNDPATWTAGKTGELAYSADNNRHYYFDGANWRTFGGGGDFTPIIPVTFVLAPIGVWTAVDLAGAVPNGTREVGGYVTIQTNCSGPGPTGIVSIASRADGTGEKTFGFIANLQCLNIRIPFRLALLEDRRLFYQAAGQITSWTGITISEFK